jgi:uncharacterized membrane protein
MSASSASPRLVNLLYMIGSLIIMGLSIPLLLGVVGPNGLYGFRTAKTLSNPDIWYAANKVAGLDLLLASAVMFITTLLIFGPGKRLSTNQVGLINLGVVVVALGVAIAHSFIVVSAM